MVGINYIYFVIFFAVHCILIYFESSVKRCGTCFSNITTDSGHICKIQTNPFYEYSVHMRKPQNIFSLKGSVELNLLWRKKFFQVETSVSFMSKATCGILEVQKNVADWKVVYNGTQSKTFGIGIAIFRDNKWQPKFKLVSTKDHVFFLDGHFDFHNNLGLIAILGLKLSSDSSMIEFLPKRNQSILI